MQEQSDTNTQLNTILFLLSLIAPQAPPGGKGVGLIGPDKFSCRAEALVAPGQRGVDDVLAIPTHSHEAAVGVVLQRLWVQIAAA